jgi:Na+-transporting NADH:ubiquinone oxidoreductase subunit F
MLAKAGPPGKSKIKNHDEPEIGSKPRFFVTIHLVGAKHLFAIGMRGGGTCGMCKCQVIEGVVQFCQLKPGFFTRKQQPNIGV